MTKPTSAKRRAAVRRRRTLLGLLVLLVVVAVALFIWRPWESGQQPAPVPSESAPAQTDAGETEPAESPEPEASETPEPTPTQAFTPIGGDPAVSGSEPCTAEQISITPVTDRTTYAADEPVQLSFTIENTGEAICALNAGTSVQEYEIRTGDELVYRWSDCALDVQDAVVALEPGTPRSSVPFQWDRTRSSADACGQPGEEVAAGGAAYNLSVQVGEFAGSEPRQFILE